MQLRGNYECQMHLPALGRVVDNTSLQLNNTTVHTLEQSTNTASPQSLWTNLAHAKYDQSFTIYKLLSNSSLYIVNDPIWKPSNI